MKITENHLHTSESQQQIPLVATGDENQLSGFFNDPDLDLIPKITDVEAPATRMSVCFLASKEPNQMGQHPQGVQQGTKRS